MTRTYAEIIAHALHAAGWSYGHTAYTDKRTGETVFSADAHKDGQRCVARGETLAEVYGDLRGMVAKTEEGG